jgi:hypothetical protein
MKHRVRSLFRTWAFRLAVIVIILFGGAVYLVSEQLDSGEHSPNIKTKKIISSFAVIDTRSNAPFDHLVVVPGHSVLNIESFSHENVNNDNAWKLLDYQEKQGLPDIISSHILTAVNISNNDIKSVLVFSGGQTRMDAGPISEGLSYYIYSKKNGWLDQLDKRVFIEEYSRDSFENLLFSLCRFKEVTGVYPSKVTIVGFDFKEERYSTLHRVALDYPQSSFTYVGMRPTNAAFEHELAALGEQKTIGAFRRSMYGCDYSLTTDIDHRPNLRGGIKTHSNKSNTEPISAEIVAKRLARNPYKRSIPYEISCPEVVPLLRWCGPGLFGDENKRHFSLPWNNKIFKS